MFIGSKVKWFIVMCPMRHTGKSNCAESFVGQNISFLYAFATIIVIDIITTTTIIIIINTFDYMLGFFINMNQ